MCQQQGAAHDVLQFAHVARPGVKPQQGQRGIVQAGHACRIWRMAQGHAEGERGDIVRPLAQGAQGEREDVEAVIEVRAKAAFGHFGRQVAVGAGDHANVHLDRACRADRHHFLFLQGAQQLGLEGKRQFGDLVQQQGAAVRGAHEALARLGGAGEGALLVAEQHGLQHGFGHGGAVHRDERAAAARAAVVDEAAEHFLAGAGRPVDEHGNVAVRQTVSQGENRDALGIGGDRFVRRSHGGEQHGERRLAHGVGVSQRDFGSAFA
ncbi:hypothetical protein ADT71_11335 [Novosphingobium sp. ST904]|nr:hypothetical protein ADT71_11335 [Novosphingobium sp. ST904]